jgi:DNA-binding Xre family transcriptional regulator
MNYDTKEIKFLKEFGLIKGWSLEDTEEHGWPSWQHMQKVETGQKNITILTIKKICELYKVKFSDLFQDLK